MFKPKLKIIHLFTAIILTLGLSISFQSLLAAWTAPTATPPDANVGEPINSGPGNQIKTGGLGLGGTFAVVGPTIDIFTVNIVDENVGIGALPNFAYVLDVTGDVNIDGSIRFEDLTNCSTIESDANGNLSCGGSASLWTDAGGGVIYYNQAGTENRISVNSSSNSAALAVYQAVDGIQNPTSINQGLAVINTNGNNRTLVWNDNSGYARISGSGDGSDEDEPIILNGGGTGRVGIGDITPQATLDIGGGIRGSIDGTGDLLVADDLEVNGTFYGDGSGLTGLPWGSLTGVPADIADGDDYNSAYDTEAEIDAAVANNGYLTSYTETDPQVNNSLTAGNYCIAAAGNVINCNKTAAEIVTEGGGGGGSSLWTEDAFNNIYYNGGHVGVGVNSPAPQLAIKQSGDSLSGPVTGSGVGISIIKSSNNDTNYIWTDANSKLRLSGGGDESRDILLNGAGTGYVGIGIAPSQKLHINGNIRADGRHVYLGASQDIYGDNSSAIYYDSNHDTVTQMIFRDTQNTIYGRVYGSGDGINFGFLDGDGNWSFLAQKDTYTQLRINNIAIMTLRSDGDVGIGDTTPDSGARNLKLDVEGPVGATHYCDQNGNNCTAAGSLGGGGSLSCTVVSHNDDISSSVTCPAGYTLTGGGCYSGVSVNLKASRPSPSLPNTWSCRAGNNLTAYAVCCRIQ